MKRTFGFKTSSSYLHERQQNMKPMMSRTFAQSVISSPVIKFLVIFAVRDNVGSSETHRHYQLITDLKGASLCANTSATPGKIIESVRSPIVCSGKCSSEEQCVGFNFRSRIQACELVHQPATPLEYVIDENCSYFEVPIIRICNKLCLLLLMSPVMVTL